MKQKKNALFTSIISLLLCVSMLVGTTFAWFTDSVTTGINQIAAGNLDVELYHSNAAVTGEKVDASTKLFLDLQGDPILWEPGVVSYENLRVTNEGDLALVYQLAMATDNENFVIDPETGAKYGLSQILKVGLVRGGISATDREGVVASVEEFNWTTLGDFARSGSLLPEDSGTSEETWGVVVYWQPGENDNLWNLNNGKQLSEGETLSIDLGVKLIATQEQYESDAFGSDYDRNAAFPKVPLHVTVSAPVVATTEGTVAEAVTLSRKSDGVTATIPEGVTLAADTTTLTLTIDALNESEADIQLEQGETMMPLDIHVEGVAENNTTPMLITLEGLMDKGLNTTSVSMYHVEDGVTVAMKLVTDPTNHNEFSYDPATGDVILCVATFSEYVAVTDNKNLWQGEFDTSWYNTTDAEFTLNNAEQLAGFGKIVDGTAESIAADTFAGKTVKLGTDIDLSGGYSLNPIGCGYVSGVSNSDGVIGTAFMGTFDGQGYTISGLYQNGWELGLEYCNLGGGLFASVANGTVKNLTISGADITMECVEMGVLVGLSQGNCTYENINIYNSKIANYQRATGGLIGEVSAMNGEGTTTITNVVIGSDVVVGSLWGDFDCPVGGVIGARWDDANVTKVVMEDVEVACRLDVYNDVTSTYQWYAYRRAGMLIGNTDTPPADGKNAQTATADFLTCANVTVRYGTWVDYHYCEFNNHNPSWPWVRVEAGENCSAFSNPRYGVPNDPVTGQPVTTIDHNHSDGDDHNISIKFDQLYGGGQGVYGQASHDGVTVESYDYTITYMDRGVVFKVDYESNDTAYTVKHNTYVPTRTESEFKAWVNAGGTKVDTIAAGNTTDYVLYDSWYDVYTARFVDSFGTVIYEEEFSASSNTTLNEPNAPAADTDFTFSHWEIRQADGTSVKLSEYNFGAATGDITIYPVYSYDGQLSLTPIDNEPADGIVDYYRVDASKDLSGEVEVPGVVNGVPVVVVQDLCYGDDLGNLNSTLTKVTFNEGVTRIESYAVAYTTALAEVELPSTLEYIGANAFASQLGSIGSLVGAKQKITFTYNGTCEEWEKLDSNSDEKWDNDLVSGSMVICNDGYYVLESTTIFGYGTTEWAKHAHAYGTDCVDGCP